MKKLRIDWSDILLFVLIAGCFSLAVYKINDASVSRVAESQRRLAQVQATAQANGRKVVSVCRGDVTAINDAHDSIRAGFRLEARIAQDNISAIAYATRRGLIPSSLIRYYRGVRDRQVRNRDHFQALARRVHDLKPLC